MSNIDKLPYRADGGDICTGRLKEIADNPYGDEEKCWLAKRVLALLDELEADGQQIKTLESRNRRLDGIIATAEKRIAELQEHRKAESVEVIYQCEFCHYDGNSDLQWHWEDVNKDFYDQYDLGRRGKRRVLYTAPSAPVVPQDSAVESLATDLMKRIDRITGERHSVATLSALRVSIVEACRAAMQSVATTQEVR
ncbi:hypothetical protein [Rouxiella badensis]|uniref:hypothetical protein n=1 Tax=Rouxiella badensis TaxID=1646377 RepID=UPI0028D1ADE0|nr:hypothetical protein [Rouxiella badensis]